MSSSVGVLGGTWRSSLVRVEYEDDAIIDCQESKKMDKMISDESSLYASPINSRITKVTSFSTDLGGPLKVFNTFRNIAKHHFIEIETQSGRVFTFEKTTNCILLQSCPQPVADAVPVVRTQRHGEKRPKSKRVVEDVKPRTRTVLDILKWIRDTDELAEPYNVVDSNCQDFCKNLWSTLTEKSYPNPSKVGKGSAKDSTAEAAYSDQKGSISSLSCETSASQLNSDGPPIKIRSSSVPSRPLTTTTHTTTFESRGDGFDGSGLVSPLQSRLATSPLNPPFSHHLPAPRHLPSSRPSSTSHFTVKTRPFTLL